jgi:hypothetical protein
LALFGNANPFSDGVAAVRKGWKWGVVDKAGKLVVEADFEDAL